MDIFDRTRLTGREQKLTKPLLFVTQNLTQLQKFVSASLQFLRCSIYEITKRIEISYLALCPLRFSNPNPIKTRNPAPARICNSRFPPLFSAQIPNITAKKSQIPHPAKPIGDPLCSKKVSSDQGLED